MLGIELLERSLLPMLGIERSSCAHEAIGRSRWAAVAALPGPERLSVSTYDFDQVEVAARDERTVIAMSAKCFDCDNSTRFQAAVPLALAVPGTCGAAARGGTGKQ
jgi:hypothetical protein